MVLQIAGHTDGTGTDAYNHYLSQKRALWVKEHLEEKYGIGPGRLHVIGLGATNPLSSNITSEGRDKNRRIELRVLGISGRMFPTPCETSAGQE